MVYQQNQVIKANRNEMISASYLMRDSKTAVTDKRSYHDTSLTVNPDLVNDEVIATAEKKQNYMGSTAPPDAFKHTANQSFMTS